MYDIQGDLFIPIAFRSQKLKTIGKIDLHRVPVVLLELNAKRNTQFFNRFIITIKNNMCFFSNRTHYFFFFFLFNEL